MRNSITILVLILFTGSWLSAQVKIGDNPQNIDPSSILELESSDKVLVITRVTTTQMNAITPSQGALCYNTDLQSVHFYDGTQWINIGAGSSGGETLTANAIVNDVSTIVITPTGSGNNFEVAPNSIRSEQIIDGGINGIDIQDGSIGPGKLQNNSVTEDKLSENSVGAFALDNDNIGVSAFNNDAGYITAAQVTSYDDTDVINDILDNATAIAADNDQSITNEIQNLLPPTLSAANVLTLNISDGNSTTVDLNSLVGNSGSDNQNLGTATLDATTKVLTINIENGDPTTVNLSSLGGGGTTADGSETKINDSATVTVTGAGTTASPYVLTASGGTGSTEYVDGTTLEGAGTTTDRFRIKPSTTTGHYLKTTATGVEWANVPPSSGSALFNSATISGTGIAGDAYTVAENGITTAKILNGTILTEDISRNGALDGQILVWDDDANGVGLGEWVPGSSTGSNNSSVEVTTDSLIVEDAGGRLGVLLSDLPSSGSNNSSIEVTTDSLIVEDAGGRLGVLLSDLPSSGSNNSSIEVTTDSLIVEDAGGRLGVLLSDLPSSGSNNSSVEVTTDSLIVVDAGGRLGVPRDSLIHKGSPKSIFYAGADGKPTQFFHPATDKPSFFWDYEGRTAGGVHYGTLAIGVDGNPPYGDVVSNHVKVHIAENLPNTVAYPLLVHQQWDSSGASTGSGVGIMFASDRNSDGKGALVFERRNDYGIGDFHFLLNDNNVNTDRPELPTDKAFTIKNNKDIVLYGGIDIDGTGLGTNGHVLTSTGTGLQWSSGGLPTGTTDNQILTWDADAINATTGDWILSTNSSTNIALSNLVQNSTDDVRTYDITATTQSLQFTGLGKFGIGNFGTGTNPATPENKFHVLGAIRSEGILNSNGTAGIPSYRFSGDTNSGMYWSAADELGFATGGETPLKIKQTVLNGREVIVDASLELKEQVLDKDKDPGISGQILSSTNSATDWIDAPDGAIEKGKVVTAGTTTGNYTIIFATAMSSDNYIINTTVQQTASSFPIMIQVTSQTDAGFSIQINEFNGTAFVPVDATWFYTIYKP